MRQPAFVIHGVLVAVLLQTPSVRADSAADKATAREVATEGIALYKAEKYAEALDRLRRAQALYEAPVHLLYIARSEEKLGLLVEASETYRTLDREVLPVGAPEAWVSAASEGRKELALLEPRLPKLRLSVEPRAAPEMAVQIDGAKVSSAVVGIARAVNPGRHHVVVSAAGRATSEADVEVKEGQTSDVALTLSPLPGASGVSGARGAPGTPATGPSGNGHTTLGLLVGLRLGVGMPTGKIVHDEAGGSHDINVSDGFQPGGGLELHGGVRIGRYFTPVLYLEGQSFGPGDGFATGTAAGSRVRPKNTGAASFGLGLLVGTPPGKMGGFGELDLVLENRFAADLHLSDAAATCKLTARGSALRFGGGGVFPLASWLQLTPFAMATIGRFSRIEASGECQKVALLTDHDIASGDTRTHATIVLGVGGDVLFGNRDE